YDMVDPMVAMPFPWSYGTSWEDPYSYVDVAGTLYLDTLRWTASTWGTVRLPGGTDLEVAGMWQSHFEVDTNGTEVWTYFDDYLDLYAPGLRCRVAHLARHLTINPWGGSDLWFTANAL